MTLTHLIVKVFQFPEELVILLEGVDGLPLLPRAKTQLVKEEATLLEG